MKNNDYINNALFLKIENSLSEGDKEKGIKIDKLAVIKLIESLDIELKDKNVKIGNSGVTINDDIKKILSNLCFQYATKHIREFNIKTEKNRFSHEYSENEIRDIIHNYHNPKQVTKYWQQEPNIYIPDISNSFKLDKYLASSTNNGNDDRKVIRKALDRTDEHVFFKKTRKPYYAYSIINGIKNMEGSEEIEKIPYLNVAIKSIGLVSNIGLGNIQEAFSKHGIDLRLGNLLNIGEEIEKIKDLDSDKYPEIISDVISGINQDNIDGVITFTKGLVDILPENLFLKKVKKNKDGIFNSLSKIAHHLSDKQLLNKDTVDKIVPTVFSLILDENVSDVQDVERILPKVVEDLAKLGIDRTTVDFVAEETCNFMKNGMFEFEIKKEFVSETVDMAFEPNLQVENNLFLEHKENFNNKVLKLNKLQEDKSILSGGDVEVKDVKECSVLFNEILEILSEINIIGKDVYLSFREKFSNIIESDDAFDILQNFKEFDKDNLETMLRNISEINHSLQSDDGLVTKFQAKQLLKNINVIIGVSNDGIIRIDDEKGIDNIEKRCKMLQEELYNWMSKKTNDDFHSLKSMRKTLTISSISNDLLNIVVSKNSDNAFEIDDIKKIIGKDSFNARTLHKLLLGIYNFNNSIDVLEESKKIDVLFSPDFLKLFVNDLKGKEGLSKHGLSDIISIISQKSNEKYFSNTDYTKKSDLINNILNIRKFGMSNKVHKECSYFFDKGYKDIIFSILQYSTQDEYEVLVSKMIEKVRSDNEDLYINNIANNDFISPVDSLIHSLIKYEKSRQGADCKIRTNFLKECMKRTDGIEVESDYHFCSEYNYKRNIIKQNSRRVLGKAMNNLEKENYDYKKELYFILQYKNELFEDKPIEEIQGLLSDVLYLNKKYPSVFTEQKLYSIIRTTLRHLSDEDYEYFFTLIVNSIREDRKQFYIDNIDNKNFVSPIKLLIDGLTLDKEDNISAKHNSFFNKCLSNFDDVKSEMCLMRKLLRDGEKYYYFESCYYSPNMRKEVLDKNKVVEKIYNGDKSYYEKEVLKTANTVGEGFYLKNLREKKRISENVGATTEETGNNLSSTSKDLSNTSSQRQNNNRHIEESSQLLPETSQEHSSSSIGKRNVLGNLKEKLKPYNLNSAQNIVDGFVEVLSESPSNNNSYISDTTRESQQQEENSQGELGSNLLDIANNLMNNNEFVKSFNEMLFMDSNDKVEIIKDIFNKGYILDDLESFLKIMQKSGNSNLLDSSLESVDSGKFLNKIDDIKSFCADKELSQQMLQDVIGGLFVSACSDSSDCLNNGFDFIRDKVVNNDNYSLEEKGLFLEMVGDVYKGLFMGRDNEINEICRNIGNTIGNNNQKQIELE